MSSPEAFLSLGTIILAPLSKDVRSAAPSDEDIAPPIGHLPETEDTYDGVTTDLGPNGPGSGD